jgi:hypothetical protein
MIIGTAFSGEDHERALVKAFILPQRQERYLELLSNPKRRGDATREFDHFKHLDPRWIVEIAPRLQHTNDIFEILRGKGAPESCYGISDWEELDQKVLPLIEALKELVGAGMGAFLSCLPGRLAYFEDEEQRCILERATIKARP